MARLPLSFFFLEQDRERGGGGERGISIKTLTEFLIDDLIRTRLGDRRVPTIKDDRPGPFECMTQEWIMRAGRVLGRPFIRRSLPLKPSPLSMDPMLDRRLQ